jgi:hypothetical protein
VWPVTSEGAEQGSSDERRASSPGAPSAQDAGTELSASSLVEATMLEADRMRAGISEAVPKALSTTYYPLPTVT